MEPHFLGIDLGGTKVSAAVLNGDGEITGRARAKTKAWRDDEEVFETIVLVGRRAIREAGIEPGDLAALGIGSPGPLDLNTGYIIEAANLNFRNFPLGPRLAKRFNCPAVVENDVRAGTYGEFKAGAARGSRHALGVFIGTGIGGGLIIDGALYHGFSNNAGEVGHMVLQAGGPRCGCGNRGCLEALASRTAMTRDIKRAIKRGAQTKIAKMIDKRSGTISSAALRDSFDEGDELVTKIILRAGKYIGIAIGSLVNVLGPQVVILGGGVIEAMGDVMVERIDRAARKTAFESAARELKIVRAHLRDDSGVVGAAMLAQAYQSGRA